MSPVIVTEVHRRAGQAGPFPGVGAGALVGVCAGAAAVPGAAVAPAAAAGLVAASSGRAIGPHDATDATSDATAATAKRRPRSLEIFVSTVPILWRTPFQHA
ncbi:MAG TPA: hypothetical protein VFE00_04435 [Arthrobacter sp.]|nr:hypothetical protein [Arthrobacter sp.]